MGGTETIYTVVSSALGCFAPSTALMGVIYLIEAEFERISHVNRRGDVPPLLTGNYRVDGQAVRWRAPHETFLMCLTSFKFMLLSSCRRLLDTDRDRERGREGGV